MKALLKGGFLAAVMSFTFTTAAAAMDPAMMDMEPESPMFDAVILEELRRLNAEIQMLSLMGMESQDEEVREFSSQMLEEATERDQGLSLLRNRMIGRSPGEE